MVGYEKIEWENDIYKKRFDLTLRQKNISNKKLFKMKNEDGKAIMPSRTYRRITNETKRIKKSQLDALARAIDVDPDFLIGRYDDWWRKQETVTKKEEDIFLNSMHADNFPYADRREARFGFEDYIKCVLGVHDIGWKQFSDLNICDQNAFSVELERAMVPVLSKYFPKNKLGFKTAEVLDLELWNREQEIFDGGEDEED